MDGENCDFPDFSSDAQVCGQAGCRDNGTDEQNLHIGNTGKKQFGNGRQGCPAKNSVQGK